jgi:hypothetical protein
MAPSSAPRATPARAARSTSPLTNGGGTGCFTNNGKFISGDSVTVGSCGVINAGTIEVGSKGVVGKTTISGDYVQEGNGQLNIDAATFYRPPR